MPKTLHEQIELKNELHDIMFAVKKQDPNATTQYQKAGQILVQLDLLEPSKQTSIPDIIKTYASYTKKEIDTIVNKSQQKG